MKSLFILLFLTVGQLLCAQQSVYFEKFYDQPVMPDLISRPFLIDDSYYFVKSNLTVVTEYPSIVEFFKISLNGDTEIHKTITEEWPTISFANGLALDQSSHFVVFGVSRNANFSTNKIEIRKMTLDGDSIFYKSLSDSGYYFYVAEHLYLDSHDNIYLSGSVLDTLTFNEEYPFILKADSEMNIIYYRKFSSDTSGFYPKKVCLESGNCFFYGTTNSFKGSLLKVDEFGNTIFDKRFIQTDYIGDGISRLSDGDILLSGAQDQKAMITKVDTCGNIIWDRRFISVQNQGEEIYMARELRNHDIIGVGITKPSNNSSDNDAIVICTDGAGELKWRRNYEGYGEGADYFIDFVQSPDNGILVTGIYRNEANSTSWVLKLDSLGCSYPNCSVGIDKLESKEVVADVWPNPFSSQLNFDWQGKPNGTIEIFNTLGEKVYEAKGGKNQIPTFDFAAGLYEIQVQQGGKIARMKVVKE